MGATRSGTQDYFSRFKVSPRIFGRTGLLVSPIGFGGYRIQEGQPEQEQALELALESGYNLIDTSSNYADGSSERLIGKTLEKLLAKGKIQREQIVIVTKAGYLQGENLGLAQEKESQGEPFSEVVKISKDLWHCISPEFLEDQITRSLERLKTDQIDVLLLHNPEYFLKKGSDQKEYYSRIRKAFLHLETEAKKKRIQFYGISSNTFGFPETSPEFTSLGRVLSIADEIGPENHFAAIQLPLNLLEPGGALEVNNQRKTVLELAEERETAVLVNRPLNAITGHELIRLADFTSHPEEELGRELGAAFEETMRLEENCPDPHALPMDRIAWGHILHEHFEELSDLEKWRRVLTYQAIPTLQMAEKSAPESPALQRWIVEHQAACIRLFQAFSAFAENRSAQRSREIAGQLDRICPELRTSPTLSRKVLRLYQSVPGVRCVLV